MKICFVLDDKLDSTDGVQQYILALGGWFSSQGNEVHYLVGQTKRTDISNTHSLTRNLNVRFNQNKLSIPIYSSKKRIKELLERENFDILHIQLPYSPQFGAKVISLASDTTAVIGTFHILPYSFLETKGTKLLGKVLAKSIRRFDKVMSVSSAAQEFVKNSFGIDSEVVPNVVDVVRFRSSRKLSHGSKVKIAFLGRLVPRKGALELVRALSKLDPALLSNVEVLIGGTGSEKKKILHLIDKYQLIHAVKLVGFVTEEDKPNFLGQSDIAVFPATGGESFGIVLLEAMAAGAGVVLGGDNPGYRCVLGEWPETLVNAKSPSEFAKSLEFFISQANERQRIHTQQQRSVEQYNVPRVGQRILKIYNEAIEMRRNNGHTKK